MMTPHRPCRSALYIPGSKSRALEKARTLATDAIIFDLEDAVAPTEKEDARKTLSDALAAGGYGKRIRLVRINALDTPWGAEDLRTFAGADIDGILLPKVNGAPELDEIETMAAGVALWAMMETARGILHAEEIADHKAIAGLVMGTNDLAKELGSTGRDAMQMALQNTLLAARAAQVTCIDGVYNAFKDDDGLRAECEQGAALGFDGKTLIHPAQLAIANEIFAPSDEAIELAKRQIAAFEEAKAQGQGVAVVDGRIVENLHIVTATAILAKSEQIKKLEAQL